MRAVAALLLITAGSLFTYWTFMELFVAGSGTPVEWAFATAFGWLVCHDVWQRFFGRPEREPLRQTHQTAPKERGRNGRPVAPAATGSPRRYSSEKGGVGRRTAAPVHGA
jgi:hypothetical protein